LLLLDEFLATFSKGIFRQFQGRNILMTGNYPDRAGSGPLPRRMTRPDAAGCRIFAAWVLLLRWQGYGGRRVFGALVQ
jgi:hypothetical protein